VRDEFDRLPLLFLVHLTMMPGAQFPREGARCWAASHGGGPYPSLDLIARLAAAMKIDAGELVRGRHCGIRI
jgi:hypothetical protein